MRPIATEQSELRYPLDVLLGTKAQIRVLRFIGSGDREVSPSEISEYTGISHPGTLKVLAKLERTGFVQSTGSGRSKLYSLTPGDELTEALRTIFKSERDWHRHLIEDLRGIFAQATNTVESAWLCLDDYKLGDTLEIGFLTNPRLLAKAKIELRDRLVSFERHHNTPTRLIGLTRADLPDYTRTDLLLLTGYSPFESSLPSFQARSHQDLDERSLRLAELFGDLIKRNPTIVTRTKEHLDRIINENPELTRTDILEWRRILESYSRRQLLDFLVDPGEFATRLRQSLPFLQALTPKERAQIQDALESNEP